MSITIGAKKLSAQSFNRDSVTYYSPQHTASHRDEVRTARQAPKPTAQFSGFLRSETKITSSMNLTGALTPKADAIITISTAIPVGYNLSDLDALRTFLSDYVASGDFEDLVEKGQINFDGADTP